MHFMRICYVRFDPSLQLVGEEQLLGGDPVLEQRDPVVKSVVSATRRHPFIPQIVVLLRLHFIFHAILHICKTMFQTCQVVMGR